MVSLKRAYERPEASDGARVLVERLWPRGVKKKAAKIDLWPKDLAPSDELRQWFHAHPRLWPHFRQKYLKELCSLQASAVLQQLYDLAEARKKLTLVFGSRDTEHNSAVVLKELLDGMRKPPTSSGPERAAAAQARLRTKR